MGSEEWGGVEVEGMSLQIIFKVQGGYHFAVGVNYHGVLSREGMGKPKKACNLLRIPLICDVSPRRRRRW